VSKRDIGASVRQRLLNQAHEQERPFQELLQYFVMERFLYRLSKSSLSFAKTPHEAILVHVTCYAASLYVIDSTCALDFGEAQAKPEVIGPDSAVCCLR